MSLDTGSQLEWTSSITADVLQSWLSSGPTRLCDLMAQGAPGTAGQQTGWEQGFGTAPALGATPQLWRIGTGYLPHVDGSVFPAGVPLLDRNHLHIDSSPGSRVAAEALVESLLLRIVRYFEPGLVRLHIWDATQFAGRLPGLYPLRRGGLLTVHRPTDIKNLLSALSDQGARAHNQVLSSGHSSLAALSAATGERSEPWTVVALLGVNGDERNTDGVQLDPRDTTALQAILSSGPAAGISAVLLDLPLSISAPYEQLQFTDVQGGWILRSSMTRRHAVIAPDEPLPTAVVSATCAAIAEEFDRTQHRVGTFADLLPSEAWGLATSHTGLSAPVGFVAGKPVRMRLDDDPPHGLISGPSGKGKTNFIQTAIASFSAQYPVDELEFLLLDFKHSVSFDQYAPHENTPGLPHARLVGVNINKDPEFGLAVLEYLVDEMERRAVAARARGATDIEGLRAADPAGHWPRIVAIFDEVQVLFTRNKEIARRAGALTEEVARQGRSHGIHLIFSSQRLSGIAALDKPEILEQFSLRVAMPQAQKVLAIDNNAATTLPLHHAILNHDSGVTHGNETVKMVKASSDLLGEVQRALHDLYPGHRPQVFDGNVTPTVAELVTQVPVGDVPYAALGRRFDLEGRPALVQMDDAAGRNIGIVSASPGPAVRVMDAAVATLAQSHRQGMARFLFATLVRGAGPTGLPVDHEAAVVDFAKFESLAMDLYKEVRARQDGRDGPPTYLVVYGMDAGALSNDGVEALRRVIRFGPGLGVHVIGWSASPRSLKDMLLSRRDDMGVVLGLDVQGSDFGTLISAYSLLDWWSPRADRGLMYDRAQHSDPKTIIIPGT